MEIIASMSFYKLHKDNGKNNFLRFHRVADLLVD